jgi:hypothetical protein
MGIERLPTACPRLCRGKGEESRSQARYRDEEYSSGSRVETSLSDKSRDVMAVLDEYVGSIMTGTAFPSFAASFVSAM